MVSYIALLRKDAANNYCVSFPDFPICNAVGHSAEEVQRMATENLASHFKTLTNLGEPIAVPSTFDDIMANAENRRCFALVIEHNAELPKVERICVSVPLTTLQHIDHAVNAIGCNRSTFVAEAALEKARRMVGLEAIPYAADLIKAYRQCFRDA